MFQIQVRSVHIILQFNIELFYHACPLFLAHSHLVGNAYIFKVHFLIKACSIEAICCYFGVRYVDFIFVFTFCFLTLLFLLFFIFFWVLQSQNLDKLRFRFVDYIDWEFHSICQISDNLTRCREILLKFCLFLLVWPCWKAKTALCPLLSLKLPDLVLISDHMEGHICAARRLTVLGSIFDDNGEAVALRAFHW